MGRKSIPSAVERELWATCGGYCQNPNCRKNLFVKVEDAKVSIANMAHIIGSGKTGPRSEHETADYIDKNGFENLIMLCLDCHKIVDELEKKFAVEAILSWKKQHIKAIKSLFAVPNIEVENDLLREVNDRLEENEQLFKDYGPFSKIALADDSSDAKLSWRKCCLEKILPNNQFIVELVEKNKRNFGYPWDVYKAMLSFKTHVDSFRDNCLSEDKVNDYKQFPSSFDYFIKTKLGIESIPPEMRDKQEIEFRMKSVDDLIGRFLAKHDAIAKMEKRDIFVFYLDLKDGREMRVFVTNTYFLTMYTLDKIFAIDAGVDVILCSSPYVTYTDEAKRACINKGIGLFTLGEFMGAINKKESDFLNFLLSAERERRINRLKEIAAVVAKTTTGIDLYVYGSYLRNSVYNDIDILMVHEDHFTAERTQEVADFVIRVFAQNTNAKIDLEIIDNSRQASILMRCDNRVQLC